MRSYSQDDRGIAHCSPFRALPLATEGRVLPYPIIVGLSQSSDCERSNRRWDATRRERRKGAEAKRIRSAGGYLTRPDSPLRVSAIRWCVVIAVRS
jgi:hypothetical protein